MATDGQNVVAIAIDDSSNALQALQFYFDFVHKENNFVFVLHCIEFPYKLNDKMNEVMTDRLEEARVKAKKIEAKYVTMLKDKKVHHKVIADFGHPGEFIVDRLNSCKASMCIMGSRGQSTLRRTIMGSVSDYVMHHAKCPVTICKQ